MKLDLIIYSLKNIFQRKTRSFLTTLSILIGVMATFAILSFGLGIQNYVAGISGEAGVDKIFIQAKGIATPGTNDNFFFTQEDVNFVEKIKGVDKITGLYMTPAEIEFKNEKKYYFLSGMNMKNIDFILESFTMHIEEGKQLRKGELGKVTLGYLYQFDDKIFKKGISIGDKIKIQGEDFKVSGFYNEIGNPSDDGNIYITLKQFEELFPEKKNKFAMIMLQSEEGVNPGDLAEKIQEKLRKFKGQEKGKEDFYVQTFEDAIAVFNNIFNVLIGMLILIAFISILVASVNIMNTMYTAVLERIKEIGIMKAIGAQNKDILFIFIFEAGFLGLVGGTIGVVLGYLIASAGGAAAAAAGYASLQPIFPIELTLASLIFSFFIGAVSGISPAWNASKKKPVDALKSNE